mgnify:FL=1
MTRQPSPIDLRLDVDRRNRLGMVEAIWGEHKTTNQIVAALEGLRRAGEVALVTRMDSAKSEAVLQALEARGWDASEWSHHADASCLTTRSLPAPEPDQASVAILAGGSSDLRVASEAMISLACHGIASDLLLDVGVAGLHRLLARIDDLRRAPLLIACAGMEGALPTVLAGLLPQPVIGVPVSVGYGVSEGGKIGRAHV